MTEIINFRDGPLTPEQRRALVNIRRSLEKTVWPLNAEQTLARAICGVIDAMLPGIDADQ